MIYPGRFLALVLLASVTSLGLIYHYFGFSSAPTVLVPGSEQEAGVHFKPVVPLDDEPTILEPTENAVFQTLRSEGEQSPSPDDAYPDIGDVEEEPPRSMSVGQPHLRHSQNRRTCGVHRLSFLSSEL